MSFQFQNPVSKSLDDCKNVQLASSQCFTIQHGLNIVWGATLSMQSGLSASTVLFGQSEVDSEEWKCDSRSLVNLGRLILVMKWFPDWCWLEEVVCQLRRNQSYKGVDHESTDRLKFLNTHDPGVIHIEWDLSWSFNFYAWTCWMFQRSDWLGHCQDFAVSWYPSSIHHIDYRGKELDCKWYACLCNSTCLAMEPITW